MELWSSRGVFYLSHLIHNGELKTFDILKTEYELVKFRYLQIRRAFRAQFSSGNPQLDNNPLVEVIRSSHPKKLISIFYNMLVLPLSSTSVYALKSSWEGDMGTTEWSEALDTCKLVSPKLSDHLTQIYIVHRSYLTPLRISRYKRDQSANCPMCEQEVGNCYHL